MTKEKNYSDLKLKHLGIDTYTEFVIYMRKDCHVCRSEGFVVQARVQVTLNDRVIIATLNTIDSDLLQPNEASLSQYAWEFLAAKEGDQISISHPKHLDSLSYIRAKIYGNKFKKSEIREIVNDVVAGQLSDIHITMFLTAIAGNHLSKREVIDLTHSMVATGKQLKWPSPLVVDKHCVGGVPGNRTTLIVVPIVAAFGLMIPKTSSRAITSPAGTADTMEVFAPVNLDIKKMQKIIEQENGFVAWGGYVSLSPADDLLIRVERSMDLDSEGQLVASILSKKIAVGSTHILIDIPIGETVKVRSLLYAEKIKNYLEVVARKLAIEVQVLFTDGSQPVGRGIGPALEAKDVLAVLTGDQNAPQDLRERALTLAGHILEYSPKVVKGEGKKIATEILDSKQALKKFEAICKAQGGMFDIPTAPYTRTICSKKKGRISRIDNRALAQFAKLAGAPQSKSAGIELFTPLNSLVEIGQPLFTVHAETQGELRYALDFHRRGHSIMHIEGEL